MVNILQTRGYQQLLSLCWQLAIKQIWALSTKVITRTIMQGIAHTTASIMF